MPSRLHRLAMLSSPRRPSNTIRIFSCTEYFLRVFRLISRNTDSDGIWDIDLRVKGDEGPIVLTYQMWGEFPVNQKIVLLDVMTKKVFDLEDKKSIIITSSSEKFPYQFKIVSGTPDFVDKTLNEVFDLIPDQFSLSENYPNPFNPINRIRYSVPMPSDGTLTIYNIVGQEVAILVQYKPYYPLFSYSIR